MKFIKRFILMIQFLTTIPLPFNLKVEEEDFGKGLVFAPVVGILIGSVLALVFILFELAFSIRITAALVLAVYILLTGGLHLDGLGDTFDGVFSHRSKERMLEIMRDSRVGTNAVLGIAMVLLLDWLLLTELDTFTYINILLLIPVAGRIGSITGAAISKYARNSEGLGKSFIDICSLKENAVGLVFSSIIFFLVLGTKGLLIGLFPFATAVLFTKWFGRKIGGATGDTLGAVCELNQTAFLLLAVVIF
jgi:adenosylcobinamide-GDP ribazoletransferase